MGAHIVSYSLCTAGSFPGCDADNLYPSCAQVKNEEAK
jgi:hypothetical protein